MKLTISLVLASAIALGSFAQGDSFHDDSRNFDIRLDYAGYTGTIHDDIWDTSSTVQWASVVLTPQMSWAVSRSLSIGWAAGLSHYLDAQDQYAPSASLNGFDANFIFDIHFLRAPKADMMLGCKLGIAGIRKDMNDGTGNVYGSLGLTGDLHLMGRFYVSERLAIIGNLGVPGYTFNKFGKNTLETSTIKTNGFCVGSGIAFKLGNQRTAGSARNK